MSSKILVALRVKATPERAFEAFTREIGEWWRPNMLFAFTPRSPGFLSFEGEAGGRLIETLPNGVVFEVGAIRDWSPPTGLAFGWRQAAFAPDQVTEVSVRFEAVGAETRVTVEHTGWDTVPQGHVARHGFPASVFLHRHGQWWQGLLASLAESLAPSRGGSET